MRNTLLLFVVLCAVACSKTQRDLTVKTNIKDLKKGTVYLKRVRDTALVIVDSVIINGNSQFELHSDLQEPDVFYLYLDKNSNEKDRITFFADKGITEINTSLKNFVGDAKINGSEQQKLLEQYLKLMSRLNNKNLELIKENFEAQKKGDTLASNGIQKKKNNLIKMKYLQTVNFALNNNDSEIAPYLALSKIFDARIHLLDTINKSLTPKIKASKYGGKLQTYLNKIRKNQ